MTTETDERCPCGRPLHYVNPEAERFVRSMIAEFGPTMTVRTHQGAWVVPRHYMALHIMASSKLPELARLHSWRRV